MPNVVVTVPSIKVEVQSTDHINSVVAAQGSINNVTIPSPSANAFVRGSTHINSVVTINSGKLRVLNVGIKGDSASSAVSVVNSTAGINVYKHQVICVLDDYTFSVADPTNIGNLYRILGVSTIDSLVGQLSTAQISGVITEASWNWTLGSPVYVGSNGSLTQIEPLSGILCIVGRPVSNTSLLVTMERIQEVTTPRQYVYVQNIPASVWDIQHNLNSYPDVAIRDSTASNELVYGTVRYIDLNSLQITFSNPFGGEATLT